MQRDVIIMETRKFSSWLKENKTSQQYKDQLVNNIKSRKCCYVFTQLPQTEKKVVIL
jgi:heme/copper-type cytochrome/quinol oxidase subunit 2